MKWKCINGNLLHRILPNRILLSRWKICSNSSLCKVCDVEEDYFIECAFYEDLLKYVQLKLGQCHFEKDFSIS